MVEVGEKKVSSLAQEVPEGSSDSQDNKSLQYVYSEVKELILTILELDPKDHCKIVPEADFQKDLGADSLDQVEVIMAAEDKFGVEIPDEKAQQIKTVFHAVKYIHSVINGLECDLGNVEYESGSLGG